MRSMTIFALALCLSGGLVAAPAAVSPTVQAMQTPGSYEKDGTVYAVGEVIRVKGSRHDAEMQALKDAAARLAAMLEKKGVGKKKDIALGVENAYKLETELKTYKLGKVQVENVYQERWEAPDGKESWNAKIVISVRRR
jgi:hypothetical protein